MLTETTMCIRDLDKFNFDSWLEPIFDTAPTALKMQFTSKMVKSDPKINISPSLPRLSLIP